MWKCKICGVTVSPVSSAVAAHYEKSHFSVFIKNGSDIRRLPKAFLREVTPGKRTALVTQVTKQIVDTAQNIQEVEPSPKKLSDDPIKNRTNNIQWLVENIKDIDRDHTFEYQDKVVFECPCCRREMEKGKRLKRSREDYIDICADCFKAARKIIMNTKGK